MDIRLKLYTGDGDRLLPELDRESIVDLIYPIGSIYLTVNESRPEILFGGEWVEWGQGRVPIGLGQGAGLTNQSILEYTGGSETISHTHTSSAHTHTSVAHTHTSAAHTHAEGTLAASMNSQTGGIYVRERSVSGNWPATYLFNIPGATRSNTTLGMSANNNAQVFGATGSTTPGATGSTTPGATGSTTPNDTGNTVVSIVQPYIVCYMWKRIA